MRCTLVVCTRKSKKDKDLCHTHNMQEESGMHRKHMKKLRESKVANLKPSKPKPTICKYKTCTRKPVAKQYCHKHYTRLIRTGTVEIIKKETKEVDRVYGVHKITRGQKNVMLINQAYMCAICPYRFKNATEAKIDHEHYMCKHYHRHSCDECRRKLLCNRCNTALGGFKDSQENLLRAIEHLKLYPGSKHNVTRT